MIFVNVEEKEMNLCERPRNTIPILSIVVLTHLSMMGSVSASSLSGTYTMNAQGVSLTLVLQEDGRGNLGGRLTSTKGANYQVEGVIQDGVGVGTCVSGQEGVYFEAHPQGNQLLLALIEPGPDKQPDYNRVRQLVFTRQTGAPSGGLSGQGQGLRPDPMGQPQMPSRPGGPGGSGHSGQPGGMASGGQEHFLQGRLCSHSGSSSSSSSYSRTGWAHFDGRGNFTYGSEASFSSGAGLYHSGGGNADGGGTYRVMGNQIQLMFSDGTTGLAKVVMQQNNGRITEVMYEGTLYAVGLCQ
jgi:hypothetical protein